MTRRQVSEQTAQQRSDVAAIDAYARRVAGHPALPDDDEFAAEIDQFVQLHERVATLVQPDVAPAVRSVVLGAAAQVAQDRALQQSGAGWKRLLAWCLRPGPVLGFATVAGLVVAVGVRQEASNSTASAASAVAPAAEVAMGEVRAPEVGVAPAPVAVAPSAPPAMPAPEAAAGAAPAVAAADRRADSSLPAAQVAARGASPARDFAQVADSPAAAPAPAPTMERPSRTIEAQAASLGPVDNTAMAGNTRNRLAEQLDAEAAGKPLASNIDVGQPGRPTDETTKKPALYAAAATADDAKLDRVAAVREEKAQTAGNVANAPNVQKNIALANQASVQNVVQLQNQVKDVQTDAEREVLLEKLVVAAREAGDRKAEVAAQLALNTLRAKRSEANQKLAKKPAENLQASPPVQRAKNAPAQSSDDLKAGNMKK